MRYGHSFGAFGVLWDDIAAAADVHCHKTNDRYGDGYDQTVHAARMIFDWADIDIVAQFALCIRRCIMPSTAAAPGLKGHGRVVIHGLDLRVLRSFVMVVETGSVTETARRLGRTQPAITLQIQRLEEMIGRPLLTLRKRQVAPTEHGHLVLSYARSILQQHDELLSRLAAPDIEGHVVLGTPDLYAASLLPPILRVFRHDFPGIQVELHCHLSTPLVERVRKGVIDIALVTRMNDFTGGIVVRQEQLVWLVGDNAADILSKNPLPLALLPPGNIYRDHAIEAIERAGRRWRVACVSESVAGLQAAVFAGMAVTVLGKCAIVPGMRQVGRQEYLPALPMIDLLLYRAPGKLSAAANALHDYLVRYLAAGATPSIPAMDDLLVATPQAE